MYQKIMVPLDGSELAECVLPHVETIAKGCQANSVMFVRVVEPVYFPTGGDIAMSEKDRKEMESGQRSMAEDYMTGLVGRLQYDGVGVQSELIFGRAAESLAEYATKNEVDLIIIATHGRSGISRWVWGSVAERILRSACVPVLMVRAPGCIPGV
jgi:nucleotide-binding universal stress UspA family protein